MRDKIQSNQDKIETILNSLNPFNLSEDEVVKKLLKKDLFFPKKKLKGVVFDIFRFWESWIIRKHLSRSKNYRNIQEN